MSNMCQENAQESMEAVAHHQRDIADWIAALGRLNGVDDSAR